MYILQQEQISIVTKQLILIWFKNLNKLITMYLINT